MMVKKLGMVLGLVIAHVAGLLPVETLACIPFIGLEMDPKGGDSKANDLIQQAKELGYDPKNTEEFKGVIKDLQSERTRRQTLEEELAAQREQNALLAKEASKKEDDDFKLNVNDDEYIKAGEAKKIIQASLKKIEKRDQEESMRQVSQRMKESEEKAKAKYTADKYGEGMDYQARLEAWQRVKAKHPSLIQEVREASDPAEAACEFAKLDPEFASKLREADSKKMLNELNTKTGRVPRGAGGGAGISLMDDEYESILEMSNDQIDERLAQLEGI